VIRSGIASAHVVRSMRLLMEAYAGTELPEWEGFARSLRSVRVDPGDTLFSAGEPHPFVYYVEQGLLKAQVLNSRGRSIIAFFSEEGDVLASMPALAPEAVRLVAKRNLHPRVEVLQAAVDGVSIHTLVAIQPSLVHRFDYRIVDQLAFRHAAWGRACNALSMMYAITLQADNAALRSSPEQRYRSLLEIRPDLIDRVSKRDLASFLNVTDVALSRIAKRVLASDSAEDE
jgi:CRP-like cAMP-binding protein